MSERGERLYAEVNQRISALLLRLAALDDPLHLREPCPGREKLGDGSIATVCTHLADVYLMIEEFVRTGSAKALRPHRDAPTAGAETITCRLATGLEALAVLRDLPDAALEPVPNAGAIRFADGDRSLEQVLDGLLRHQGHQVDVVLRTLPDRR